MEMSVRWQRKICRLQQEKLRIVTCTFQKKAVPPPAPMAGRRTKKRPRSQTKKSPRKELIMMHEYLIMVHRLFLLRPLPNVARVRKIREHVN